jgi:hypothetical protein
MSCLNPRQQQGDQLSESKRQNTILNKLKRWEGEGRAGLEEPVITFGGLWQLAIGNWQVASGKWPMSNGVSSGSFCSRGALAGRVSLNKPWPRRAGKSCRLAKLTCLVPAQPAWGFPGNSGPRGSRSSVSGSTGCSRPGPPTDNPRPH